MMKDARIDLLLATADERRPVLEGGLSADTLLDARRPKRASGDDDSPTRDGPGVDPNLLPSQRWGVIAPDGPGGDQMLEAIAPLIKLRQEEQEAQVRVYRVRGELDGAAAVSWKNQVYQAEDVPRAERPRYLLVLGELDDVTLDLQQTLSNGAFAGRLCFSGKNGAPDLERYAAYAEKVERLARRPSTAPRADALFYVADDGTDATKIGRTRLVNPCLDKAARGREHGTFAAASVRPIGIAGATVEGFLANVSGSARPGDGASAPSVLLTVTHGLGAPAKGWPSTESQRRRQGALWLGEETLEAEAVAKGRFLPGGMWFCLACFGAGTPTKSVFRTWLSKVVQEEQRAATLEGVMRSLPGMGFVAALPQAALANPEGPLAVIGHMDLAWMHTITDEENPQRSRASRIFTTLELLVGGKRAGVALDVLMDAYRWANHDLMTGYELEADAKTAGRESPIQPEERANLWMLRNDLRAYMLLGDPAARLPLSGTQLALSDAGLPAETSAGAQAALDTAGGTPGARAASVARKEEAVFALLRGDEAPCSIAARAGISLDELYGWFDAYRLGGRDRLGP